MKWLKAGILIYETIARTVDRIGPVSFEPIEKHPDPHYEPDDVELDRMPPADVPDVEVPPADRSGNDA